MTDTVKSIVEQSAIYIPFNCEGTRIIATFGDDGYFLAEGEETGEQYEIQFSEVDLKNDMFYKLVLVDTAE